MAADIIPAQVSRMKDNLRDPFWRWCHLYWIRDEKGQHVLFNLRPAIISFVHEMHRRNIILKARQLGFSTFILIYILDTLLFCAGMAAAIVAHRLDSAKRLFREKIAYPYNHLPLTIRRGNPVISGGNRLLACSASQEITLGNGSSLVADVSVRSGTYQLVHLSEYGPLCADAPQRALEVKTGSLETAHENSLIFIESTAKGPSGHFFELCKDAQARSLDPRPLESLEYKFHFYPWFRNPAYIANPDAVKETEEQKLYFARVEASEGVILTPEQRAWYIFKKRVQKSSMRSEHPSTWQEAFEAAVQGAYYADALALLMDRGQICDVPHMPGYAVHTVCDLGYTTGMWFWQMRGPSPHVIRYHEVQGWAMPQWGEFLDELHKEHGYRYGQHFAPFDTKTQNGVKVIIGQSIIDAAEAAGIHFTILPVEYNEVRDGIPRTQDMLPLCYFDQTLCERGLWCARMFHEGVNLSMSTEEQPHYTGKPAEGPQNHGADALRYLSLALNHIESHDDYYLDVQAGPVSRPMSPMAG